MSGDEPKLVTTTISAYDQSQLRAAYKSVLMGVGVMAVMHVYLGYSNPLLVQSLFFSSPSSPLLPSFPLSQGWLGLLSF